MYELYAVLIHQGSASFGHYYALIQDLSKSEWFEFNDSVVKPIKPSELKRAVGATDANATWSGGGASAYMLLYRRVEPEPAPPVSRASSGLEAVPAFMHSPFSQDGERLVHETKRLRLTPPHSTLQTLPPAEEENPYARMDG